MIYFTHRVFARSNGGEGTAVLADTRTFGKCARLPQTCFPDTKRLPRTTKRRGKSAHLAMPMRGVTAISTRRGSAGSRTVRGPRVTSAPLWGLP